MVSRKRSKEVDFFESLEDFNGSKYPECVKRFLCHAAYDTKNSCLLLDEKSIVELEQYIMETGKEIIEQLSCCNSQSYQNQQQFRFLPGHRSCILAIPNQIRDMEAMNFKKRKPVAEFKKLLTAAELKNLLIKSLNRTIQNLGFETKLLSQQYLGEIKTMISNNQMTAKCDVQCFHCPASQSAVFNNS